MRHLRLLVVALCVVSMASCCRKLFKKGEHEIIFKPAPQKGAVTTQRHSFTQSMVLEMSKAGTIIDSMAKDEEYSFEYTSTVMEVAGDEIALEKMAFQRATHVVAGETVPYGFQGEAVIWGKAGTGHSFAYENGTSLSKEDLEGFSKLVPEAAGEVRQSGNVDALSPGKPVKVGDTWTPDVGAVAMQLLNLKNADTVDLAKSTAELTFVSLEEKDGLDLAHVTGTVTLHLLEIPGMKFQDPIVMTAALDGLLRTDPTVPDGTLHTELTMKGESPVEIAPGQVADVSISMRTVIDRSVESVD